MRAGGRRLNWILASTCLVVFGGAASILAIDEMRWKRPVPGPLPPGPQARIVNQGQLPKPAPGIPRQVGRVAIKDAAAAGQVRVQPQAQPAAVAAVPARAADRNPPRKVALLPRPARVGRLYTSPESGPESVLDLDLSDFDEAHTAVVKALRSRMPDPKRTSLVELRPMGSLRGPGSYYAKTKTAVFGVLRAPNAVGALMVKRMVFFVDERGNFVASEDGGETGPYFNRLVREYYPDEPLNPNPPETRSFR
jgi:hypothetical protein